MKLLVIDPEGPSGADARLAAALGAPTVAVSVTRVGPAAEAEAALRDDPTFDCLVLSLGTGPAEVIATFPAWQRAAPGASLVAVAEDASRATVMAAIRAGASSFIERRGTSDDCLVQPLRTVIDGGLWLPPVILERRAPDRPGYGTWVPEPRTPAAAGLGPTQAAVLRAFVADRPASRIAAETGLSETEVAAHLAELCTRLDAGARLPMVLAVARLGLRFGH